MKKKLKWFLFILCLSLAGPALSSGAPVTIKVGFGEFPPIFIVTEKSVSGFWIDLLELINKSQNQYHFVAEPVPPNRRLTMLEEGDIDTMANENLEFGWDKKSFLFSTPVYSITDRFVALKEVAKNQSYFSDLKGKQIRAVLGYHYHFENEYEKLHIPLALDKTISPNGNLLALLDKRAEIAVVSDVYLSFFYKNNPGNEDKLLVSKKGDNHYKMSFVILKKESKISLKDINKILHKLEKSGELQSLRNQYRIQGP